MSIFVHSSAKLTKSSQKVHKKGAKKYSKMGTVNDPNVMMSYKILKKSLKKLFSSRWTAAKG
jgi:hypothetical protein